MVPKETIPGHHELTYRRAEKIHFFYSVFLEAEITSETNFNHNKMNHRQKWIITYDRQVSGKSEEENRHKFITLPASRLNSEKKKLSLSSEH